MSCRRTYGSAPATQASTHCVISTVKKILEAQNQVTQGGGDCLTSCDQSIRDLLSGPSYQPTRPTTIPFMLYSKDCNKPFFGSGFCVNNNGELICMESPVFRVKNFSKGSNNCAVLELLTPAITQDDNDDEAPDENGDAGGEEAININGNCLSLCSYFGTESFSNFEATGICITVDLNCFCGISCLPAITPVTNYGNTTARFF